MSKKAVQALMSVPDITTKTGRRDLVLLIIVVRQTYIKFNLEDESACSTTFQISFGKQGVVSFYLCYWDEHWFSLYFFSTCKY